MATSAATGSVDKRYRTFWRRCGAAFIDSLVLASLGALVLWAAGNATSSVALLGLYLVNSAGSLVYSIVLHGRFGQTLGKMVARVRVVKLTESAIGIKQALWRDSPWMVFALIDAVWGTTKILRGQDPFSLQTEGWIPGVIGLASLAWFMMEVGTMLTNPRRRAIHDWIARTVVVRV